MAVPVINTDTGAMYLYLDNAKHDTTKPISAQKKTYIHSIRIYNPTQTKLMCFPAQKPESRRAGCS
jgi:hypothetical protein